MKNQIIQDKYKIISEIGSGGMSVVYIAEHIILKRKYAIKMLSPHLQERSSFRDLFIREGLAQAQLKHDHIVQIIDFIDMGNKIYLVMDYIDGKGLDEIIENEGIFSEHKAIDLIVPVLDALNYAHSKGVIHRDIKPSNIMISKNGKPYIIDFGIAMLMCDSRMTGTGLNLGTSWYMSPEQIQSPKRIDHRTDVYSTGIILYEMLTGSLPFDGESDYKTKESHVHESVIPPMDRVNTISFSMNNIIIKALEKNPDARFSGCGEFLTYILAIKESSQTIHEKIIDNSNNEVVNNKNVKQKNDSIDDNGQVDGNDYKYGTLFYMLFVFLLFGILLCYYYIRSIKTTNIDEYEILLDAPDPGNLYMDFQNIEGEFSYNTSNGRVFLVKGRILNQYRNSRSNILIGAKLLSEENQTENKKNINTKGIVSKYQEVYAGNILSNTDINKKEKEKILKLLTQKNNKCISSGEHIPFMFVFFDLPTNLEEYQVQTVSSKPCVEITKTHINTEMFK